VQVKKKTKRKRLLDNLLDEKKEIDKNYLEEEKDEGFTRLDVDYLLQNFLANILEELNKAYKKQTKNYKQRW